MPKSHPPRITGDPPMLMAGMRTMSRQIRRTLNVLIYAAIAAAFLVAIAHPLQPSATNSNPGVAAGLSFPWTHQLAREFPRCAAHLPTGQVATQFVVRRLSGHDELMAFDDAWHRTHDQECADDVWVEGQCP